MNDDNFFKAIFGVWIVGAILSLGMVGAVIWGIISLVNWLTTQNF